MINNNEMFLLKLGEVVLKGLNRHAFEDKLVNNVRRRLKSCGTQMRPPPMPTSVPNVPTPMPNTRKMMISRIMERAFFLFENFGFSAQIIRIQYTISEAFCLWIRRFWILTNSHEIIDNLSDYAPTNQIGRASCRERV